jgi:hypothetical protein
MPVITGLQSQLSQGVGAQDDYGLSDVLQPHQVPPTAASSLHTLPSSTRQSVPSASAASSMPSSFSPSSTVPVVLPRKAPLLSCAGDKDSLLLKLENEKCC